jgi:hypothetical protein
MSETKNMEQKVPLRTLIYAGETLVAEVEDVGAWQFVLSVAVKLDAANKTPKGGMAQP